MPNEPSSWLSSRVNFAQTNEARKVKYEPALELGANSSHARRMRDWPKVKIMRRFGLA